MTLTEGQHHIDWQIVLLSHVTGTLGLLRASKTNTLLELNRSLATVETNSRHIEPLRKQLHSVQAGCDLTARRVTSLEDRLEGAENRSRRNNIFYVAYKTFLPTNLSRNLRKLLFTIAQNI